jgi:glycerol-3-phosphate dehydrogenase (NAD(P)+)
MVAEGVKTAASVMQLAERHGIEMPICDEVHRVVTGEISGSQAYQGLRPAGHEAEPG